MTFLEALNGKIEEINEILHDMQVLEECKSCRKRLGCKRFYRMHYNIKRKKKQND